MRSKWRMSGFFAGGNSISSLKSKAWSTREFVEGSGGR